jgi:ADP-ribose pyrophosphatase YjhB (NUDIX family)
MTFCSICGQATEKKIPPADNRVRDICTACGEIAYQNPKNVVGTIPVWENKILLCRRAIEPRKNYWTLPAGFLELHETSAEGAARETLEETGARVETKGLFSVINVPHIGQIHWFYIAQMHSAAYSPTTSESTEVALFEESQIPWDELAFATTKTTLRYFYADLAAGKNLLEDTLAPHLTDLRPLKA